MTAQYNRQLSLQVIDPGAPGTTTTFTDSGAVTSGGSGTTIEFGLPTPGASSVISGTRPTAGFKIVFNVARGDIQTPNSCDVRIYNLSGDTMNQVSTREFRTLKLSAGYAGNFGSIFTGDIKQVRIGRESALDSYLDITAADGDRAYNFANMDLPLAAGHKPGQAIKAMVQSMALGAVVQGFQPDDLPQDGALRNRIFWGKTWDEIYDYCEARDLIPSIQDGKFTLINKQGFIPSTPVLITPQNGLLGVPEQTQNGIEATVLLNPQIKIGQLVQLQNTTINQLRYGLDIGSQTNNAYLSKSVSLNGEGLYYVMSIDHVGDTRGPDWESRLTLLSVNAQLAPLNQGERVIIQPGSTAIRLN